MIVIGVLVVGQRHPETKDVTPPELVPIVQQLQRDVATLSQTVRDQSTTIAGLQAVLTAQNVTLSNVQTDVAAHSDRLQFVTVDGTEMYITGANLNIRDGRRHSARP